MTSSSLIVGSEGTLAVVTAAWLRLTPAPEAAASGRRVLRERRRRLPRRWGRCSARGSCRPRSSISTRAPWPPRRRRFRTPSHRAAAFMLIAEADGSDAEAAAVARRADRGARRAGAVAPCADRAAPRSASCGAGAPAPRPRSPLSAAARSREDIVVPVERLREAIAATRGDRRAPSAAGLQLGSRRRRQPALDLHDRPRGLRSARARRAGGHGAVRARRASSEARSRASTASGWSSAARSRANGPRRRSRCTSRSSACSTPRGCSNPGKKLAR